MPANRVMAYATCLRMIAAQQGLSAVIGHIHKSVRWRFSYEARLMRAVATENQSLNKRYGTDTSGEVSLRQLGVDDEDAKRGNGIYRAMPESSFSDSIDLLAVESSDYLICGLHRWKGQGATAGAKVALDLGLWSKP